MTCRISFLVLLLWLPLLHAEEAPPPATTQPADGQPADGQPADGQPAGDPATDEAAAGDPLHPRVEIKTSLGTIVLELDAEKAPITVNNFVAYADAKFYDGTIFHRVMADFMIQGGGYNESLEEKRTGLRPGITNEWTNGLGNDKGTIAMARLGGKPNSATAQFFINTVDNPRLSAAQGDGAGYAVFGKVVGGEDVVEKIRSTKVIIDPRLPMGQVVPAEPVMIESVTVVSEFSRNTQPVESAMPNEKVDLDGAVAALAKETGKEVQSTESGLRYVVLKEGDGASPAVTDSVEVHYTGWLTSGKKFDSSVDRGQTTTFPLQGVIKGWTEGVSLMKVGEKRKYIIPSELAYGKSGRPPVIPPSSPLVFEIELIDIK